MFVDVQGLERLSVMDSTERIMARRNTTEFIRADAISVKLIRSTRVASGAGGTVSGSTIELDPQFFRLVPAQSSVFKAITEKIEGPIPQEEWLIVGRYNADIQKDDEFTNEGRRYQVKTLSTDRGYRTAAGVVDRGAV